MAIRKINFQNQLFIRVQSFWRYLENLRISNIGLQPIFSRTGRSKNLQQQRKIQYISLELPQSFPYDPKYFIFSTIIHILTIKITLKMNSPTTNILNSINALKSKLRKDHHELQYIRKEFSLPPTQELPEENLDNN